MGNMKVHHLAHGFWEHEPSVALSCKPLRTTSAAETLSSFDLNYFIRHKTNPPSSDHNNQHSQQVDIQGGGTRWNPTQEQIGILEMMYRGGVRTPTAQQIEQITEQLGKYGKIEGKNVFYWFQNHKARERQKKKRNSLGSLSHCHRNLIDEDNPYKRKCRRWSLVCMEEENRSSFKEEETTETRTLELFPLHPEGR